MYKLKGKKGTLVLPIVLGISLSYGPKCNLSIIFILS